ncbi:MAG: hypothetical protein AB8G99_14160 [Planctomycetaceae bacterium]
MFFWLREFAGWALAVFGVYLIWLAIGEIQLPPEEERRTIEGAVLGATGVMVLRGGIHLIRAATAARIVMIPRGKKAEIS